MEHRKEETTTIEQEAVARSVIKDSRSPSENLIGNLQEKLGLHHEKHAQQLLESVDKGQAAARATRHWQEVLDQTQDPYARRYFEGLVHVSALKSVHNQLVGLAHDKASKEPAYETVIRDYEGKARTALHELATKVKPSTETGLIEKGLAKAKIELDVHRDKAGAHELLQFRYQELGKDNLSQAYQDRSRLENATSRGLTTVVTAYETKLKTLETGKAAAPPPLPNLHQAQRALERAEQHLEDSHKAHQKVQAATREVVEIQKTITHLEKESSNRSLTPTEQKVFQEALEQRDKFTRAAEGQALDAVASYRQYHQNVKAAELAYDALSRALTGKGLDLTLAGSESPAPLERTEQNTTLERGNGDLQGPGRGRQEIHVTNSSIQEPELRKPAVALAKEDYARVPVGAVVQQTLKQIDHEL
ncbi:MAG: hypothetical protein L0387_42655 [Acidobacteria bacterium]|nr:hypothetical protein [Acidobacteriota bacterium]MCI0721989.1 hypothetical protein [Acidobacteriota bacterium]